jgi:hypothetical protein
MLIVDCRVEIRQSAEPAINNQQINNQQSKM